MSFEGTTREQQPPTLAIRGDDANPDLVAALADTSSNKANESRIDNLLNILQGKSTKQSWDPTLIRYIEEGDDEEGRLKGGWELFIQPNDWDLLINRGLTWAQLEIFVEAQQTPGVIGPLSIMYYSDGEWCDFIQIGGIYIHQFRNRSSDEADLKRVIASLGKLLCASREVHECALYSNAVTMRCIFENYEYFRKMQFCETKNFDLQIWRKCVDHPNLIELAFDDCSFVDEGVTFCKWLANRKQPITMLSLDTVEIDVSMLASTLRSACVKELCIFNNSYQEADWDTVTNAVSEMQNLQSILLGGEFTDHSKWLEWLSLMMTNTHLQSINCRWFPQDSFLPVLDSDGRKQITGQIYALLNDAPHVLDLHIPSRWNDKEMWKSQIKPSLIERQAMHPATVLEGATLEDAASLFGRMLCQYEGNLFNVNAVFQLLRHNSDTIKALWDSGREKRSTALEDTIHSDLSAYLEINEKLLLTNKRVDGTKQSELLALFEQVRTAIMVSSPSLTRPTKMRRIGHDEIASAPIEK